MNDPISLGTPKIAIIDDDPMIGLLIEDSLESMSVKHALREEDAIRLVAEWEPNLILLDLNLQEGKSLGFCKHLIALPATTLNDTSIIFMTASSSIEDEQSCWDAGAADFIVKPINVHTLRRRLSVHLRLQQYTLSLKQQAFIDGLTQSLNRRYLDTFFGGIVKHHGRVDEPLSLIMIDIDYFKQYNDRYGHISGDDVLKAIANNMRAVCSRPHDVLIRYGGEEFLVILPETDVKGANFLAQALVGAIFSMQIGHQDSPYGVVTISAGVATSRCIAPDSDSYIESADRALYKAKQLGKNRWVRGVLRGESKKKTLIAGTR